MIAGAGWAMATWREAQRISRRFQDSDARPAGRSWSALNTWSASHVYWNALDAANTAWLLRAPVRP